MDCFLHILRPKQRGGVEAAVGTAVSVGADETLQRGTPATLLSSAFCFEKIELIFIK